MKRILTYIMVLLTGVMYSCNESDDPIFEDPDTRLSAVLADYSNTLVSAPNGWIATIYPVGGKGFSYYMTFGKDGRVKMLSDFNASTAETVMESSYRLKALQLPTLIFDTYTYIHLPHDPTASINGGATGTGLKADFEFGIESVTKESIVLRGTENDNAMVMVPATATEAASYLAGNLKQIFTATNQFVGATKNPYIQFADGKRLSLQLNMTSKVATFSYLDAADAIQTVTSPFSLTLKGISLSQPFAYGKEKFQELLWDATTQTYYLMSGTTRVDIQSGATPIIPLRVLLGAGKSYSTIEYNPATLPASVSADFAAVYNKAKADLLALGTARYDLRNVMVIFNADNTMSLRIYFAHATGTPIYQGLFNYEMTKDASGNLKFRYLSADGNATVVQAGVAGLRDYFVNKSFSVDWVVNPNSSVYMGGLYNVEDPSSFYYGTLIK